MIALAPRLDDPEDLTAPDTHATPLDGPSEGADLAASESDLPETDFADLDLDAILHDYLQSSLPLVEIAAIHGLSLTRLAGVLDSPPVRRVLDTLERESARRAAIIAAEARPEALARLRQLVRTPIPLDEPHEHKHDELARKAANRILTESRSFSPPGRRCRVFEADEGSSSSPVPGE